MSRLLKASLAAAALIPAAVMAMGGASGPKTTYEVQGHLGEIVVNPYEVAPLTAIIRNGGYQILDARVTVLPKPEGEEISYNVSRRMLLTHGGIPVFGLYPDYLNSVKGRIHAPLQRQDGKILRHLQDLRLAHLRRSLGPRQ